jgi:hypothetical protein
MGSKIPGSVMWQKTLFLLPLIYVAAYVKRICVLKQENRLFLDPVNSPKPGNIKHHSNELIPSRCRN